MSTTSPKEPALSVEQRANISPIIRGRIRAISLQIHQKFILKLIMKLHLDQRLRYLGHLVGIEQKPIQLKLSDDDKTQK